VGALGAYYATRDRIIVHVHYRGPVAGGTTVSGEGNYLVSDKEPGPELDLAVLSSRLWRELARLGGFEYEAKGGLVVAETPETFERLVALAAAQNLPHEAVPAAGLRALEPHLAAGLAGGVRYPQDAQVQPMLAAARLLRAAAAEVRLGVTVTGFIRSAGRVTGDGDVRAGAVVNAAGAWGGELAAQAGVTLPVLPRRGFILVTEPLPEPLIRHKVYTAAYVTGVASDSAGLETSAVVEGT